MQRGNAEVLRKSDYLKIDNIIHPSLSPSLPPFPQNTGPKYLAIKTRKRASKAEYSKRLEQYETDFTAQIYQLQDVDAMLAAATEGTDDA